MKLTAAILAILTATVAAAQVAIPPVTKQVTELVPTVKTVQLSKAQPVLCALNFSTGEWSIVVRLSDADGANAQPTMLIRVTRDDIEKVAGKKPDDMTLSEYRTWVITLAADKARVAVLAGGTEADMQTFRLGIMRILRGQE